MKSAKIIDNSSSRLILIFAGWAMDANPFGDLTHTSYDVAVVWDYTDFSFDSGLLDGYDEVCVIAWSFGVYAASAVLRGDDRRITRRIAVNGTMHPVDASRGIPPEVFEGTLRGLDERNLRKFYRRMCGSAEQFASFISRSPQRGDIDSLREELYSYGLRCGAPADFRWDIAIVGGADRIFPPEAQKEAWRGQAHIVEQPDMPHLPDFRSIIDSYIIDKILVGRRFASSAESYPDNAGVQSGMALRLWRLFEESTDCRGRRVLEIGCGHGAFTSHITRGFPGAEIRLWDLVDHSGRYAADSRVSFECRDAETAVKQLPDASADCVFSSAVFQWFNAPLQFLGEVWRVLAPGGILAFSTFSPDNLSELRAVTGIGLSVPSPDEWTAAAAPMFDILCRFEESLPLEFDSPERILAHLKATGVNGLPTRGIATARKVLHGFPRDVSGRCVLTYRPLYFVLKKKLPK